ncbi:MAG: hypothetical protein KME01_11035 [Chroococcus sp. CMT-3BRIN-NPC107]|jgi:hypothetical protein|nr:hypothetical protein [Chroococcus sp. CMT-3BRIN-NPC107]
MMEEQQAYLKEPTQRTYELNRALISVQKLIDARAQPVKLNSLDDSRTLDTLSN